MKNQKINQATIRDFLKKNPLSKKVISDICALNNSVTFGSPMGYSHIPVGIKEFIESDDFLGWSDRVYQVIVKELIEINSGKYNEAIFTGGIGSGKTTAALATTVYQLYLISCMNNPHKIFGLDPSSEIIFVLQNKTADLARAVDYERFRVMIEDSKYFKNHFAFDKKIKSELRFPKNVIIKPVSGASTALLGQNVFGGVLDEVNFMDYVDKSRKHPEGGEYDQAIELYNTIARRRLSRFSVNGKLPGMLCMVSSRRFPGQFTDKKEAEAKRQIDKTGKSSIYIFDKRVWEVKPAGTFSDDRFSVFAGDERRSPYILKEGEHIASSDEHLVEKIPVEYLADFERDIEGALRDIAGVSVLVESPFIRNREALSSCFGTTRTILNRDDVDFKDTLLKIYHNRIRNHNILRMIHIDLSVSSDSTGIVMGYVSGFKNMKRGDYEELLPQIVIDFALEVKPPKNGEIMFFKIRTLIYKLRDLGVNIHGVTMDSFQSVDTIQILRQKSFGASLLSIDKTTIPYDILKGTIYDGRIKIPENPKLLHELASLQIDHKKGKIDHKPKGSKDIADALAGVVRCLSTLRIFWFIHGVNPIEAPPSIYKYLMQEKAQGNSNSFG